MLTVKEKKPDDYVAFQFQPRYIKLPKDHKNYMPCFVHIYRDGRKNVYELENGNDHGDSVEPGNWVVRNKLYIGFNHVYKTYKEMLEDWDVIS